ADRLAGRLLDHLDPDHADRLDPDAYQRRELAAVTDSTGMLLLRGQLDPLGGAVVRAALDAYTNPARPGCGTRPGAEAGEAPDGECLPLTDDRTATQRRADALVAIARAALAQAEPPKGMPAHVLVLATASQVAAARTTGPAAATKNGHDLSGEDDPVAWPAECVQSGAL